MNIGFAIWGIAILIGPIVIIQESFEATSLPSALVILLISFVLYPLLVLAVAVCAVFMVYFTRMLIEVYGLGKLGRPLDMYWLLLRCSGWDQNSSANQNE